MKIAVLGAGAMGSWFGGQLALAGHAVQLLTTNLAHREAISQSGLKLQTPDSQQTVSLAVHAPGNLQGPVNLILLFTKAFQSQQAMASVASSIDKDTHVLSLQNGLGNAEAIAQFIPLERVWIGVSMMPVDKIAPGIVSCKGTGASFFGNAAKTDKQPMADSITSVFGVTNISVEHVSNVHQRIWEKVAFNTGMNALTALSHGTPGTIGKSPGARELAHNVAIEVAAVALSQGIDVDLDAVFRMITLSCEKHGDHIPSMLQDLLSKRRTEVEALNGAVVNAAERAGVPAPLNSTLATLVRLAELSHQSYDF